MDWFSRVPTSLLAQTGCKSHKMVEEEAEAALERSLRKQRQQLLIRGLMQQDTNYWQFSQIYKIWKLQIKTWKQKVEKIHF